MQGTNRPDQGLMRSMKMQDNGIILNGCRAFTNVVVRVGDVLDLILEQEDECSENIVPTKGEVDIVYEDDDLLVINKAAGVPVHPSQGHFTDTLANYLTYYYQSQNKSFVFRPVNRLDKGTSGLMCVAKNAFTHTRLIEFMKNGQLKRSYIATVCGEVLSKSGTIDAPIARKDGSTIERHVSSDGVRAVTHYQVLSYDGQNSKLKIVLETGRTHQIRVHFAHIGHPVVGDFLYGSQIEGLYGHMLESATIEFIHPMTGEEMKFEL